MITEAEKLIETAIQTYWTKTPIDWDNVAFKSERGTPYIRVQIEWTDAAGVGPHKTRDQGYVMVSFFHPVKMGTRQQAEYIDLMKEIFLNLKLHGLRFYPGRVQRVGENSGWFQRNLLIPFDADYCITN